MSNPIINSNIPAAAPHETVSYAQAKAEYQRQHDRLVKATQEFESVFIGQMLKQMRKSMTGENALFGNSSEAKMFQDMTDDATATQMSHTGTFGLAKTLFKSLERTLPPNPETLLRQTLLGMG